MAFSLAVSTSRVDLIGVPTLEGKVKPGYGVLGPTTFPYKLLMPNVEKSMPTRNKTSETN